MEKLLLFIKHKLGYVWNIIEIFNDTLFRMFFKKNLEKTLPVVFRDCAKGPYIYRRLKGEDLEKLLLLISKQQSSDLKYFQPHQFDPLSIYKQFKKKSFLMMGVLDGDFLVGYFFLRFFFNRKCFVGRLIDKEYRGKGIGNVMNSIMYETAWRMGFRCLSTISRNNKSVMNAHQGNRHMVVLKELKNDYLLVEFVPSKDKKEK